MTFLLAVVAWQRWGDIGLNKLASGRSLLLTWLPLLYIVVGLGLAVVFGLPAHAVRARGKRNSRVFLVQQGAAGPRDVHVADIEVLRHVAGEARVAKEGCDVRVEDVPMAGQLAFGKHDHAV